MAQIRRINQVLNVLRFSLNPLNSQVLLKKVFERVLEIGHDESISAVKWAKDNSIPLKPWLEALDSSLWGETLVVSGLIRENCNSTISNLLSEGIDTRVHYPNLITDQTAFVNQYLSQAKNIPNAIKQKSMVLSLPIHQHLSESQVEFVASRLKALHD